MKQRLDVISSATVIAVSYTHLDVYKRQGRNRQMPNPCSAEEDIPGTISCTIFQWSLKYVSKNVDLDRFRGYTYYIIMQSKNISIKQNDTPVTSR